jgi:sulfatase modifying factor 1
MTRWVLLSFAGLCACEGERVRSARDDVGGDVEVADGATPDARLNDGDVSMGGECGEYRGAKMVRVGSFCIDATEVTRGQFLEFLAAPVDERNKARPAECAWNTDDPPINATPAGLGIAVGDTNFCDALTYCAWARKRLCGRIGGGANDPVDFDNATKSEWFSVCSANGTQTYAYPGAYSRARCFTEEATSEATGSRTTCAGGARPYSEVFDLNGNVFEWENSCTASPSSKSTRCRTRGGGYGSGSAATCAMPDLTTVDTRLPGFGFRCCKD